MVEFFLGFIIGTLSLIGFLVLTGGFNIYISETEEDENEKEEE